MLRSLMTVSGFTAISRILGFLRDILIARYIGTGPVADAFVAAFRFPNMFRRIFGEGAFNSAFIPLFGKKLEQEGKGPALGFANNAFSTLLLVLGIGTAIAIPCMPWLMAVVVPGFMAKFDRDLGTVGAGQAYYEVVVKTTGSREVFFELEGKTEDTVDHWSDRIRITDLRFVEHVKGGVKEAAAKVFGSIPEEGKVTAVLPNWEVETGKDKKGKPIIETLEGLGLSDDGAYVIEGREVHRIPLPKGHKFAALLAKVEVTSSEDEVHRASLRVYRNDPDTFRMTVLLARIMFGYLLCMALAAHLSGVLNTFKVFGMPAAAPIILNLVFLAGLGMVAWKGWLPGETLAWCVLIAGVLQCAAVWITCVVKEAPVKVVRPKFNGEMRRLFSLMGPGVASAGIQQVNLLVGGIIASFQAGAVSYLYYSDRVYQLPLGMIGIALGVVLLPQVTRLIRSGKEREASDSILKGMELGLLLTIPAAVAMLVIPEPLIRTLFERGEFSQDSAHQTARALMGFALGLPGYVLIKVLQPGYFAREDTKTPMKIAAISVASNVVCSLLLFPWLGHVGIAIGTSVAAWVNVWMLWRGLKGFVKLRKRHRKKIFATILASLLMGLALWLALLVVGPWFSGGMWLKVAGLTLLVTFGLSVYAFAALRLRATSLGDLKDGLGRG
jgi:putative peptidoglycan lipid II flippase